MTPGTVCRMGRRRPRQEDACGVLEVDEQLPPRSDSHQRCRADDNVAATLAATDRDTPTCSQYQCHATADVTVLIPRPKAKAGPKQARASLSTGALPVYSSAVYMGPYNRAHASARTPDAVVPDRSLAG